MSDDQTAFVTARLDEDETTAKAVTFRSRFEADGHHVHSPGGVGNPPMPLADVIDAETAAHIARHDPARVLLQTAALRRLSELHAQCGYGTGLCDDGGHASDGRCNVKDDLAAIWSDHPDYRQEWAT